MLVLGRTFRVLNAEGAAALAALKPAELGACSEDNFCATGFELVDDHPHPNLVLSLSLSLCLILSPSVTSNHRRCGRRVLAVLLSSITLACVFTVLFRDIFPPCSALKNRVSVSQSI